jgi:hypothetical protein
MSAVLRGGLAENISPLGRGTMSLGELTKYLSKGKKLWAEVLEDNEIRLMFNTR